MMLMIPIMLRNPINGINSEIVLDKILSAIDSGHTTEEIRKDPLKYLVSGKTKKIVISPGGRGLKISYEIIKEMANRGDELSIKLLEDNEDWKMISEYYSSNHCDLKDILEDQKNKVWIHFEKSCGDYDRTNKHLIDIVEENKLINIGGWTLDVCTVYVEDWSYKICSSDDGFGSEYVVGKLKISKEI